MARNFGFEPTETQPYYFISYNSGDASRVGAIAREMHARGIPVWYDRGLKTGDEWEKQIALKIKKCHEMVMFVTSKLMMRENPYVRKEYSLARNYHKKIHIVYVDNIAFENVNLALQGWFVGLEYLHSVQVFQLDSVIQIVDALDDQIHFVRKKPKARDDIVKKKLTASKPQQAFADTEKSASKPQQASARTEKAVPKPPQTSVSTEKAVAKPQQASVSTEKAVSKLHQTSVRTEKAVPKPQQTSGYTEKASPKPQQNSIKEEKNTAKQQKSTIQLLSSAHKVLTGKGVRLFVFLALIALLIPAGVITIPHIRTALLSNENVSQSDTEHRDQESKEYDIRQIIPDYDPADYDDPTLYTYLENDDGTLKITGHAEQNVSEMKIPPLMDGKPVTAIAAYAFSGYFNLQKIEIPLTVSFIGPYSFENCKKIISVEIPDSVTYLGTGAFRNCQKLSQIDLPNSITEIPSNTFENCKALKSIQLPDHTIRIGRCSFLECNQLTEIVLPETVEQIGYCAFYGCNTVKYIRVPESVTYIGDRAFMNYSAHSSTYGTWKQDGYITIYVKPGSYAETYAKENKLIYISK